MNPQDDSERVQASLDAQWEELIEVEPYPDSPDTYDFLEF